MGISYLRFTKLKSESDFTKSGYEELLEQYRKSFSQIPYYQDHKLRKNGVMCLEMYFTCEADNEKHKAWLSANLEWCKEYFNRSVIVAEYHKLDGDVPEQRIYLIPLSIRGAVSCEDYCNGKSQLKNMHATYRMKMANSVGIATAPLPALYQHEPSAKDPFEVLKTPIFDNSDPDKYNTEVEQYIMRLKTYYESRVLNLQNQTSEGLVIENKMLKKENRRLEKHISPYLNFLGQYGGLPKVKKMLNTAQMFQYAIRLYQEEGDKESIKSAKQILDDGMKYCQKHGIKV